MDGINNLFEYAEIGKTLESELDEAIKITEQEEQEKTSLKASLISTIREKVKEQKLEELKNINPFELLKMTNHDIELALNGADEYINKLHELDKFYKENNRLIKPHDMKKLWEWYEVQEFESLAEFYGLNNNINIERTKKSLVISSPNKLYTIPALSTKEMKKIITKEVIGAVAIGGGSYVGLSGTDPTGTIAAIAAVLSGTIFGVIDGAVDLYQSIEKDSFNQSANLLKERNKFIVENIDKKYL